jgi:hypothetical protein
MAEYAPSSNFAPRDYQKMLEAGRTGWLEIFELCHFSHWLRWYRSATMQHHSNGEMR